MGLDMYVFAIHNTVTYEENPDLDTIQEKRRDYVLA